MWTTTPAIGAGIGVYEGRGLIGGGDPGEGGQGAKEGIHAGSTGSQGEMKGMGVPRADRGYEHRGFAAVLHSTRLMSEHSETSLHREAP